MNKLRLNNFISINKTTKAEIEQAEYSKVVLIDQLSECIIEINNNYLCYKRKCLESCENSTLFCSILEAIFLHGIYDERIGQSLLSILDIRHKPIDPEYKGNFWSTLLIITHKQVLESINNYKQIKTDIGCCRSWIRLALNDNLLIGYLSTIEENMSMFKSFYNSWALLLDKEKLSVIIKLIYALESNIEFVLPTNSSLLNKWSKLTLELLGLYFNTDPLCDGIDVANEIPDEDVSVIPSSSSFSPIKSESKVNETNYESMENMLIKNEEIALLKDDELSFENSLLTRSIISNDTNVVEKDFSQNIPTPLDRSLSEKLDFSLLLTKYESTTRAKSLLNKNELWERFEIYMDESATSDSGIILDRAKYTVKDLQLHVQRLCELCQEIGLDEQEFVCLICSNPLGIDFNKQK